VLRPRSVVTQRQCGGRGGTAACNAETGGWVGGGAASRVAATGVAGSGGSVAERRSGRTAQGCIVRVCSNHVLVAK
jgi:hypothetical protein